RGRQSLRLGCFYLGEGISMLSAFGEFSVGFRIEPREGSSVYVSGGDAEWRFV
ncbi:DEAD/DEAH box helicase, partial [Pseudomonas syringae pv. tagetis]